MAAGISAIGWRDAQRIVAVDVAQSARNRCVAIRQGKAGGGMIKYACGPRRNWVARSTLRGGRREAGSHVVGNVAANRCGTLERCCVASVTISRIQRVVVVHMAGRARCRTW
jgi:hypothetical protein